MKQLKLTLSALAIPLIPLIPQIMSYVGYFDKNVFMIPFGIIMGIIMGILIIYLWSNAIETARIEKVNNKISRELYKARQVEARTEEVEALFEIIGEKDGRISKLEDRISEYMKKINSINSSLNYYKSKNK